ncbi:MAG: NPCBM/NEW2 domain-containing protein [Acidobacteria bacterium]|nr:NPCBM/NEW2 domain-containing protein [Acidobacteriota bacterium]
MTSSKIIVVAALALGLGGALVAERVEMQDPASLTLIDAANAIWIDSLDLSRASIRRPRAPRPPAQPQRGQAQPGQPATPPPAPAPAPPPTPPAPLVLSLGGVTYAHGLPLNVNTDLAIDLKGQARRFVSMVGIDDTAKSGPGSVTFDVWVDGKHVGDSGLMKAADAPRPISIDLAGAQRLVLSVHDGGDGPQGDTVVWGGAMILPVQKATSKPEVVTPPVEAPPPMASSRTAEPRINHPRITGATPGRPFQFMIPASGEGPLTFAAKNLPAGLTLDSKTGVIRGALRREGRTAVTVTVTGPKGRTTGAITIVGGKDALALTPPLGWNSWNVWGGRVDDAKVRAAAVGMVRSGLAAQGYTYINIDDAWEGPRTATGEITANEKFPDMKALTGYVHGLGLKIGIYSSPGPRTCQQRYDGSFQHEAQDARTWSKWGFDYIKYDWCSYEGDRNNLADLKKPYVLMRGILDTLDRDFVYSLCQYGWGNVWEWGDEVGGNLWRVTGDITDTWPSMSGIGFEQTGHEKYAGPGHWNDTDMLVVGMVGWGRTDTARPTQLTPNEQITHISLWSLQAAPLLIGADMSRIDEFTVNLLGNPEVLAVNQDVLGKAAGRLAGDGRYDVWAKPLSDGTMAVGLFNRGPEPTTVAVKLSALGLSGSQPVRDLWLHRDLGSATDQFSATVPRHGAVLIKIGRPR